MKILFKKYIAGLTLGLFFTISTPQLGYPRGLLGMMIGRSLSRDSNGNYKGSSFIPTLTLTAIAIHYYKTHCFDIYHLPKTSISQSEYLLRFAQSMTKPCSS